MTKNTSLLFVLSPRGSLAAMEAQGQLNRFLSHYVDAYRDAGFQVGIFTFGAETTEAQFLRSRGDVELLAPPKSGGWVWAAVGVVRQARRLRRYGVWRGLQAPTVVTLLGGRILGCRTVTTYGYDYVAFSEAAGHRRRARSLRVLLRLTLPVAADRIIYTSEAVKEQAIRAGAREEQLLLIPNAAPILDRPTRRAPRSVVWVGRIAPQKRLDIALAACRAADAQLTIIGNGTLSGQQAAALEEAGGRHLGPRPHAEVLEILDRSEVLLCTSDFEGTPKVVVEGLARGAAVVVSQMEEIRWLTHPNGSTTDSVVASFPCGDVDAAAAQLRSVLDDTSRRAALAGAGLALARSRFDLSATVGREIELAKELSS